MVRRAGIHRIAAVVARRANADAGPGTPSVLAQLDLFASAAGELEATDHVAPAKEAAQGGPAHSNEPHGDLAAPVGHHVAGDDAGHGQDHASQHTDMLPAPVLHVVACPSCTWWVSRGATRCECCGVGLLDGALAPQAELPFLGAFPSAANDKISSEDKPSARTDA
jgi:hypothetical protein